MRGPAEQVEVDSMRIDTGLMGGVQSFVDEQEEGVAEVVLVQLTMREEEERMRKAMQSEEVTGRVDVEVEIVVVVAAEVVVVDKSNSESDQRSM